MKKLRSLGAFIVLGFIGCLFSCSEKEEYITPLDAKASIIEYAKTNQILGAKKILWDYAHLMDLADGKEYIDVPLESNNRSKHERAVFTFNGSELTHKSLWIFESKIKDFDMSDYAIGFHEMLADFDGNIYYNDFKNEKQLIQYEDGTQASGRELNALTGKECFFVEDCPWTNPACNICHLGQNMTIVIIPVFPYTSPPPNPCKQMDKLGDDTNIFNALIDLKAKVSADREYGRAIYYNDPIGFSPYLTGAPGGAGISITVTSKIDGFMHSHYTGLLSIFSGSDVKAVYDLYKANKIKNWKTFVFMVVTGGTTYAIKIDNINDFNSFGNNFLSSADKFNFFEQLFDSKVNTTNSNLQNEIGFANLIKGSGLKLFKGNPINFSTWTGITTNNAGTGIINDNCN
ncbi:MULTISPECIES: hypothetical protein [Flavobacteriaceae]|uniref:hypothetical protein n=1 Tax=Flavobacteriaceae TaxID=49546 RepID=UPI00149199C3|nr:MULTISPECIES: hypothetical protein [Allomuricauda]MDC6364505.1 hypothetical protein [Muricauda sp. AC10]